MTTAPIRQFLLTFAVTLGLFHTSVLAYTLPKQSTKSSLSSSLNLNRRDMIASSILLSGTAAAVVTPNDAAQAADLSAFSDGPGGIKYLITHPGEGEKPKRAQKVYTKYTLWTGGFPEDGGKQVDSNTSGFLARPLGVIVGVGQVIKGWDLTLLDMSVGESRRIIVPSQLGYGERGAGGAIPPNSTLYFEVEVVSMDMLPDLNEQQLKWLEDNPL